MKDNESDMSEKRAADQKFCFSCGTIIHKSAVSCPHCGAAQVKNSEALSMDAVAPRGGEAMVSNIVAQNQVFCRGCGKSIHKNAPICPHCGAPQAVYTNTFAIQGKKNKVVAGVLGIFLGGFGIHKFYLNEPGLGILYILFCWTFIPAFVGLIEGLIYLSTSDEQFARKYG